MIGDKRFEEILRQIPRSYDDFVSFMVRNVIDPAQRQQMVDFIQKHPKGTPSAIIRFYDDNFWNEEDDYDEE